MAVVEFDKITKTFASTHALAGISFRVADGEFLVVVGPSGCGKSTLLRLVTGLDAPDDGRILIDGVDMCHTPPKKRGCAMVFQSYALYPHWTVFDNIAFPMRIRRMPRAKIHALVAVIAASLHLTAHLAKRPKALSGGERQRVALGRAIAADPKIFLFDEPLSNLDAPLRAGMRAVILERHRALGKTSIYVTHDQTEALTMGDRILVLSEGKILGEGTPESLYHDPPNRFVASFLGRPPINLIAGRITRSENGLTFDPLGWTFPATMTERVGRLGDQPIELGIRPECLHVGDPEGGTPWRVTAREFLGDKVQYTLQAGEHTLTATGSPMAGGAASAPVPGALVSLDVRMDGTVIFDPRNGDRLV